VLAVPLSESVPVLYPVLLRILLPSPRNIRFRLLLSRAHPRIPMPLGDPHALVAQENRDPFDRHAGKQAPPRT